MGQKQTNPYSEYEKQYTMISKNQNDQLLIRHKQTGKQFMLRKLIVKSQQELQERIKLLNRRRKIKSQHLLNIVDFKPINDDRICGNAIYISLLIEYPFQSLLYETLHRLSQPQASTKVSTSRLSPLYFQQHQLWSILYSCALGMQALYINDMPHQCITKNVIFIDKQGVVKIGDPILLGARTNYDKVIQLFQNQKNKEELKSGLNNFYTNQKSQRYIKNIDNLKQTKQNEQKTHKKQSSQLSAMKLVQMSDQSFIISPELISLCKDHQYYFFDKEKSDIFVLGALMIQLGLLEDAASVGIKNKAFKKDLNEFFTQNGKLVEKYSFSFLSIIQSMIDIDPKKRPNLNQIVEKVEQFSIQENTNSQQNSFKKNPTQSQQLFDKNQFAFKNNNLLNDQLNFKVGQFSNLDYDVKGIQNNKFKSNYLSSNLQSNTTHNYLNLNSNQNNLLNNYSNNQKLLFNQFPSFSIPQDPKYQNYGKTSVYQQSAVKSIFSKNQPVQIKYAQSPLIVPVSNIKPQNADRNFPSLNYSTPFHNLNLTESNDKKIGGRQIDKQSIVQNKFTLFGTNNLQMNNLFNGINQQNSKKQNIQTERFSLNNFGNISLPNGSNQTSVNTSTMPTPRFQNPFNSQSIPKLNEISKPLFTPTFQNINSQNYNNNLVTNPSSYVNNSNTNLTTYIQPNIQSYIQPNINTKISYDKVNQPVGYNAKKQGFSICEDFRDAQSYSMDQNAQPYFANSSVGYTLPKYRPESTSSQIVKSVSQQKIKRNQSKQSTNQIKNINNISPTKKIIQQTQSFLQRQQSPTKQKSVRQNFNSTSMINSIQNLANEKHETLSNSSQNTVKKQNNNLKKNSGKKYNFFKKQMNQNLQKIQSPLQLQQSNKQIQSIHQQQFLQSPILKQNLNLSQSQNSITQIHFQPQLHSIYVQEKQQNGSFYRGYKLNNQRHGNGLLIFTDSGFYQGQFNNDQMEGYGKLFYNQTDLAYQGQFFRNFFHGHGILYNNSSQELKGKFDFANLSHINHFWTKYDGYFKQDQKSGKCQIFLTNGEEFQGYCQNNTFEGNGRFKTIDGEVIEGVWKNNVLVEIKNDTKLEFE